MEYNLRFTDEFFTDIDNIYNYISQDNEVAARKVIKTIFNKVHALLNFPNRGIKAEYKHKDLKDVYYLVVYSYLVFFRIENNNIIVFNVIHSARDYIKIIK